MELRLKSSRGRAHRKRTGSLVFRFSPNSDVLGFWILTKEKEGKDGR